ncbi:hypothetical protein EDD18DRAFT_649374 [Armillaria luteobubalina]|uniref:Uncharacterized protein n=1 Tax=Armillaria luteobubalina TaxID=153913 RepID=A0AA39UG62_9AGAR|nr:hypothetical protein EDD18DRAFT_649374 [Armillaria luteobubalina]
MTELEREVPLCLFQLAKHWHHCEIFEDLDVILRLKSMLRGESEGARRASIQCLSQLILIPEDDDKHEAGWSGVPDEPWEKHLLAARRILSEQPDIWIETLYDLLTSKDRGNKTQGASCLSRLIKIDSVRDDFWKNNKLPRFIDQLLLLLKTPHTQVYAALVLRSMPKCLVKDPIPAHQNAMLRHLMLIITGLKKSKSKRAGVICLSEYFVNDGAIRKLILQENELFVDLITNLFGECHCHYNDKGAVVNAFAFIVT